MSKAPILGLFVFLACGCMMWGCTKSPFDDDDFEGGKIGFGSISGNLTLSDGADPDDVFVWMEIFDVSTTTDENGHFILTMPGKASQGGTVGVEGFYRIYFFMANYLLDSAQVIVNKNEFVYGKEDIDKEGALSPPKNLQKYLDVKTTVDPAVCSPADDSLITVTIELKATIDWAVAQFPGASGLRSAVLIRNIDSTSVSTYETILTQYDSKNEIIGVEKGNPVEIKMIFNLGSQTLPFGKYEVIPFFFTYYNATNKYFMMNVFRNSLTPDSDFLKIPMKRKGGDFEVTDL